MGLFQRSRAHLRAIELPEIATGPDIELAPRPPTFDELHQTLLEARSRLVICQGEMARAEQAVEDAELAFTQAFRALGIPYEHIAKVFKTAEGR